MIQFCYNSRDLMTETLAQFSWYVHFSIFATVDCITEYADMRSSLCRKDVAIETDGKE